MREVCEQSQPKIQEMTAAAQHISQPKNYYLRSITQRPLASTARINSRCHDGEPPGCQDTSRGSYKIIIMHPVNSSDEIMNTKPARGKPMRENNFFTFILHYLLWPWEIKAPDWFPVQPFNRLHGVGACTLEANLKAEVFLQCGIYLT